ncbi:MAG: alpha/beta hydrolase [Planctomycetaceae bacterium]|nr:alpha/beta hydrolase [Planctomycetaceae bacterium]
MSQHEILSSYQLHTGVVSVSQQEVGEIVVPSLSLLDWFVFRPVRYPIGDWEPEGLAFDDWYFSTQDGTTLHGWWCPLSEEAPTVFYFHGNRSHLASRAWIVKRLQKQLGWNIFIFDYRGYGRSSGTPRIKHLLSDAEDAFDYLCKQRGLKHKEVIVVGRSLGGAVAAHVAVNQGAKALIVECTFSSLLEAASVSWPRWLVRPLVGDKLNTASIIHKFEGPLIIAHGEQDNLIPFEQGEKLLEKSIEPKYFFPFPELGHRDHPPDWFWEEVGRLLGSDSLSQPIGQRKTDCA